MTLEELSGWGKFPRLRCPVEKPRTEGQLVHLLSGPPLIARGMGRAYGDSALSRTRTVDMTGFNRLLAFEPETGELTAEAGVVLADVIDIFLPRGWFPAVTPGTRFVTVGGMIAADVHGKNHHKDGGFGAFVEWIDLLGADGVVRRCSRTDNPDLFGWTLGGMGLTGIILRAAFRLRPVESAWIRQRTIPAANLSQLMEAIEQSLDWTYSVAWIDCLASGARLGRSLLMLGEHARREELDPVRRRAPFDIRPRRKLRAPIDAPGWLLNRYSVGLFNELYHAMGTRRPANVLVDWDRYFYPLDALLEWRRIYGRRGFMQFQCVLPPTSSREGLTALLRATSEAGQGSFLAVLKRFGPGDEGRISFPMEGYTLTLDFAVNPRTLQLMETLDRITVDHGGRFYLAKDSRLAAEMLARADDRVEAFRTMRRMGGMATKFASAQSERLAL